MASPLAREAAALLQELGITHLVTLPDNCSAPLLEALRQGCGEGFCGEAPRPRLRVLAATREGEALALAAGLWLGGASPAVLIQNTGLLEAGDGLRGTASRMGVPLLLMVTCRGYRQARSLGVEPAEGILDREALVRADLDSAALMTEPTLGAWGIPFTVLRDPSDLAPVREACARARREERPVAVLLEGDLNWEGAAPEC